jgi:hypothetical protein
MCSAQWTPGLTAFVTLQPLREMESKMKNIFPSFSMHQISERLLHIMELSIGYCSLLLLLVINTANAAPFAYLNAGNSVAVVDVETMTEIQRIDVGRSLGHIDVRPGGNYVYGVIGAKDTNSREITVIDTHDYSVKPAITVPVHDSGVIVISGVQGDRRMAYPVD